MGKFFTTGSRPCFQNEGEDLENLLTHKISGMKLVANSNPRELVPGEYTYIGTIENKTVRFTRIVSYTSESVETYAGEFRVGEGGAIQFPTSIYWDYNTLYRYGLSPECTYQYIIQNGLGRIIEYVNPLDWGEEWDGKFSLQEDMPA